LIWVRLSGSPVDVRGSRLWIIVTEDITESKRLQDNLALERDRLRLLLDLNHQLISKLDLRDFAEAVLDGLSRVAGWEWGTVLLPEPDSDRLTIYLHRGGALTGGSLIEEGATIPIEGTLCGKVYRSGQPATFRTRDLPLLSPEYARDAVMQEASRVHKLENGCILPLLQGTKVLGVLYLLTASDEKSVSHDLEFLQELASLVAAALSNCLQFDQMTASRAKLASEKQYIEDQVRREAHFDGFVGESAALKEILRQAHMVASTDATVLVIGETGTGKELIARAVHDHSPRHEQSFIKVDCAAIPSSLLESELFGHERGAFTGAIAQKLGRFETADGGTLFLDEVGEIPLELQPKLLRVLQDRAFERVGSNRARQIDVRIIAATNRNLEAMVNAGNLRFFPSSFPRCAIALRT
jgi:formate hydrogenlyase transcriptional activator